MAEPTVNQTMRRVDPDLSDLLNERIRQALLTLNCVNVGIIQSFDAAKQTATVSIAYKRSFFDMDASGKTTQRLVNYPALLDVPVVVMSGGAGRVTFPIASGDECLVLFNDRDIDNWFKSGQVGPVASLRLHSMADGFAIVGVRSLARSIQGYDTTRTRLQQGNAYWATNGTKLKAANATVDLGDALTQLSQALANFMSATSSATTAAQIAAAAAAATTAVNAANAKLGGLFE